MNDGTRPLPLSMLPQIYVAMWIGHNELRSDNCTVGQNDDDYPTILSPKRLCWHICTTEMRFYQSGPWINIKMLSYQYRKSHCGDKTVVRSSYLHNGISYIRKMSLFLLNEDPANISDVANTSLTEFKKTKPVQMYIAPGGGGGGGGTLLGKCP